MAKKMSSKINAAAGMLAFLLFFFAGPALAQQSGAYYWGDSDGNGIIEVPDLSALASVLGNPSADDTLVYQGHPQSRFRQELDGNGLIEVPDYSILLGWVTGNFSSRPGNPDQLALDGDTHLNLNLGDSVTISAYALSPAATGSAHRTGFGVIFKIDPSSTCATAQIYGYNVSGGATADDWRNPSAYHYTLKPGSPDNGLASVRINTNGCTGYQTIVVNVYMPDDIEAGVVPGRFQTKLAASQKITITVKPLHDYWVENTILRNLPDPRAHHTAVWTGAEMIVWGGSWGTLDEHFFNTGGRYDPITDSWTATTTTNAPEARYLHTAVWTGTEMIVWGGLNYYDGHPHYFNTGGRYNPGTDSWAATTTNDAPSARSGHTAVWTGTEMIVWGGGSNTGGRYNPATDSWTSTTTTNAPEVGYLQHTAVWTGTEMIVWGGAIGSYIYTNTGGRYDPEIDSWIATTTTNAPEARYLHTAVWTGTEMIVWGGNSSSMNLNTGGRYNPSTDSWTATTTTNAPEARCLHTAVWTGTEMIVLGGAVFNNGGKYNPTTNSWAATTTTNAPEGRFKHTAVWTGTEMIVWGGARSGCECEYTNTGGKYNPVTDSWTATSTGTNVPTARVGHSAVWTGSEMIVWGGWNNYPDYQYVFFGLNTGSRYNAVTDSWITMTTDGVFIGKKGHTAIWTGTVMIEWGGDDVLNLGGRYNPMTDSWTATTTTNAPEGREYHTAVWTGTEMIIWGGKSSYVGGNLATGGRYNPMTDSWTATTTTNAPAARVYHTAVWTGTEMIVWGGYFNTGGRYDPATDSWIATSTTNAPSGRLSHTAVWTGNEMIIWGGSPITNTGGRYDPATDSWIATSTTNAASARFSHTAVWTGAEMIVWGGYAEFYPKNTGGRYNPINDSWAVTTTTNAPIERQDHIAVWTGTEMIIWGGFGGYYSLNSGGRYVP